MKAVTWDAAAKRLKEIVTGRIFTASSEPVDITDGDLWIDNSTTPVLKARVAGVIYEVVGAGGGGTGAMLIDDLVNEVLVANPAGVNETETLPYELHTITDTAPLITLDTLRPVIVGLSPAGYWQLNDAASPPQDSSGNARHASATANVTYRAVAGGGPGLFPTIPLNGTIPVADNNVWTPGASGMTVFFLARPTTLGTSKVFVSKLNTSNYEWVIEQAASGAISAAITSSAGTYIRSTSSPVSTVVANTWQAYCVTFSGNTDAATITLYKNGNTAIPGSTTASAGAGTVANGTALLGLGYRQDLPSTLGLVGSLAHVAIFTGVLSGANIGTIMNAADADGWF